MIRIATLLLPTLITIHAAPEPVGTVVVDVSAPIGTVSPMLYGQFLEHIYESVVGGLWAQRIPDPSFETPARTLAEGWRIGGGQWRLHDGVLTNESTATDCHVFSGDRSWTDGTLSVEACKMSGAEGFLILIRVRDDDNFYWWNLGGWGNTASAVEREEGGRRRVLEETRTATTIETGRWYRIEVRMNGAEIECLLDGQRVCMFRDDSLVQGGIGLGSWATAVQYRNLAVICDGAPVLGLDAGDPTVTISGDWQKFPAEDVTVQCEWTDEDPFNSRYCQKVTVDKTWGGIALHGLQLTEGEAYRLAVRLRGQGLVIARVLEGDRVLAEQRFAVARAAWWPHQLEFTSAMTTDVAQVQFEVRGPGTIWLDQCTLDPMASPYREAIAAKVESIHPAFIRWPGGCYAEYYHWKYGVGPRASRVTKPNYVWGGLDPNYFGTAEFIELCRRSGAAPMIVLNIGQHEDPSEEDAHVREALEWVEYCNGDETTEYGRLRIQHGFNEPFNVTYWEIGNETWAMGAEAYAARAIRFVDALRANDPRLKYLLCGSGGHNQEWNAKIIELAATHMDYLSTHQYMEGSFEDEMRDGAAYPDFLAETGRLIAASANPSVKIACTEWNQQSIRLRTGLYAGLVLNGFERNGDVVTMSCPALFIRNIDAPAWNNAFINHDGRNVFVAPNYLVMQLYQQHFLPDRVRVDAPAPLDVVATYDSETRAIVLKIVNPSPDRDVAVDIAVHGRDSEFEWEQWQVQSPSIDDENSVTEPEKITVEHGLGSWQPTFPAHSVTVLRSLEGMIDLGGALACTTATR